MAYSKRQLLDAAEFDARLAQGANRLQTFRNALQEGRARLREYHRTGASGPRIVALHAWLVDQFLVRACEYQREKISPDLQLALVAVGGYGRSELHPASDVDLLLLVEKVDSGPVRAFSEPFLQFLWDIGLEVGHSVRSLRDCVREARKDITVATNLMEARLLTGPAELFEQMKVVTAAPRIWPPRKYFEAKRDEQLRRHARFHDTAYNLEPNLKEGPGGLRDIQMIAWVAQRHFGTTDLHDLVERGFLSEDEHRALVRGRNLLWRLRNGLHFEAGRREDRLLFDLQRVLAAQFGLEDSPRSLAVEQLMQRYYRTVKELTLLNEMLLQHFEEAFLTRKRDRTRPINRRFRDHNGYLEVTHPHVFERSPTALLELFLLLQQHPELKGVRASTIRLLRENLYRIDREFRDDLASRTLFMEILRQSSGITHALRRMNAYGVLGAYLPVFGRVVGQMQHDLFHVYTVDEHSLFVVRNLRRLAMPEHADEFPHPSEVMKRAVRRERLYVAGLFHDIAKGRGGDHSQLGEREALSFCQHHHMSSYDAHLVAWLVRNHLLMSFTAQRQDISDPEVVSAFAKRVGDVVHLDNLYLLTVADIRGTSPTVWNSWKGRLLETLYVATLRELRRGVGEPLKLKERIADMHRAVAELLPAKTFPREQLDAHWAMLDQEYFTRHEADNIAWHARNILPARALDLPIVATRMAHETKTLEVLFFAPDRDGLFGDIAGAFDRLNLSILEVRMHLTRAGFAIDVFTVLPPADASKSFVSDLSVELRSQLLRPGPPRRDLRHHLPRRLKHFPVRPGVSFSEAVNGATTAVEVTAQDRPGLLHQIALALNECRVRLTTAKIATYGERAEDIFFVTNRDGQPLGETDQECLRREISRRLDQGTGTAEEPQARAIPI